MAATPGDRFGLGDAGFKVSKPTELRPVMPNQVSRGDAFEAGFSILNRTDSARELDVTRTTPLTTPTAFSIGRVIRFSISIGAAPSYSVRTVSDGYEMSGSRSVARRPRATKPKTTAATAKMKTLTGRRVENSMIFISVGRRSPLDPRQAGIPRGPQPSDEPSPAPSC